MPSISTLHPAPAAAALAVKLNPEVLQVLLLAGDTTYKPKLVVKDGHFLVQVSPSVAYPCSVSHETLRFDIYSPKSPGSHYVFTGTVSSRLNVISDTKQINSLSGSLASISSPLQSKSLSHRGQVSEKSPEASAEIGKAEIPSDSSRSSLSTLPGLYAVTPHDSSEKITFKFLHLVALGPISRKDIATIFKSVSESQLNSLTTAHTQLYSAANTFTEADVYPCTVLKTITPQEAKSLIILKDKAYKDLRPWSWVPYTSYERGLIIQNAQNALTRLGFLETHPLRRKIVDKLPQTPAVKKATGLGGGLILGTGKRVTTPLSSQPTTSLPKKAATESPRAGLDRKKLGAQSRTSPVRTGKTKRKHDNAQKICLSSSDEDRLGKKLKSDGHRSNSRTSTNSNSSASSAHSRHKKKQQFYQQLAKKFRLRYREYEALHKQMRQSTSQGKDLDHKKSLMKLFELHNSLTEWKRKLWDYHNENNMAEGLMNLFKHKKLMSTSNISVLAPSTGRLANVNHFTREASVERSMPSKKSPPLAASRVKMALNY
ncbi:hypothetical protein METBISCDRAFT_16464 [Metschnikowia bicuspidata]|uniref:Uncharacterized protein n=1 Tax=Metschnikowia bicuspidata TaxID=27322 RepID=A0A4P9ZEJ1_9ASCO|nr:hypothetical protein METBISCDRAFT_16464 [Metschnikowia bicuspidata]